MKRQGFSGMKVGAGDGDPNAYTPTDMLRVPIPKGAILNLREMRDDKPHREFGVNSMMYGMVSFFPKEGTAQEENAEGTVLWFDRDTFRVDVERRNLTAEEINEIRRLCIDLAELAEYFAFLPQQILDTEANILRLQLFKDNFNDRSKNLPFDPLEIMKDLGLVLEKMRASYAEQQEKWRRAISELSSLGVVGVEDQSGGALHGMPIRQAAEKFKAEENAKVQA